MARIKRVDSAAAASDASLLEQDCACRGRGAHSTSYLLGLCKLHGLSITYIAEHDTINKHMRNLFMAMTKQDSRSSSSCSLFGNKHTLNPRMKEQMEILCDLYETKIFRNSFFSCFTNEVGRGVFGVCHSARGVRV